MDKLDMFQARFVKVDKCGWLDTERIQTDADMQFNSKEFQEGLSVHGKQLASETTDHKKMNDQVEVTC